MRDVALSVSDGPAGDDAAERVSLSRNPLILVSVMINLPESPGVKARLAGLLVNVKSLEEDGEGEAPIAPGPVWPRIAGPRMKPVAARERKIQTVRFLIERCLIQLAYVIIMSSPDLAMGAI